MKNVIVKRSHLKYQQRHVPVQVKKKSTSSPKTSFAQKHFNTTDAAMADKITGILNNISPVWLRVLVKIIFVLLSIAILVLVPLFPLSSIIAIVFFLMGNYTVAAIWGVIAIFHYYQIKKESKKG